MTNPRNIVGPQLRRLRVERGFSQPSFAALCQRNGWDLSRDTLAKIEGQSRWVADFELVFLADVLKVPISALLPENQAVMVSRKFVSRLEHPLL